jgi:hypothetical protein
MNELNFVFLQNNIDLSDKVKLHICYSNLKVCKRQFLTTHASTCIFVGLMEIHNI